MKKRKGVVSEDHTQGYIHELKEKKRGKGSATQRMTHHRQILLGFTQTTHPKMLYPQEYIHAH